MRRIALLVAFAVVSIAGACESRSEEKDAGGEGPAIADAASASEDGDGAPDAADAARALVGATVTGQVVFFGDGGAGVTSVLLAREADFAPDGFYEKLPVGPKAFDVTGAWSIADVPAGTYWVLAGFANDALAPATAAPSKVIVAGEPDEIVTAGSQYVVGAVKIVSITPKASTASVTIADVEGEDEYRVTVHDFQNKLVYSKAELPATGGANVTFAIGAPLTVPLHYRVRVRAMKNGVEMTRTEELAGVFVAAPDDT